MKDEEKQELQNIAAMKDKEKQELQNIAAMKDSEKPELQKSSNEILGNAGTEV